jgi:type IV secretory pathway VirB9-like protein
MKAVALIAGAVSLVSAADKKPDPVRVGAVAAATGSKVVQYGDRDVVLISAKIRFTTLIQLPKNEQILEFICGDKEFWVVNGAQNFAFVKPAKVASETNLNLITAAGNVYSFVLREVGDGAPDLKVFVEPRDNGFTTAANGSPRFVPASAVDDWREQAVMAREAARKAEEKAKIDIAKAASQAQREKDEAISHYPATLKTNYRFKAHDPTFQIEAIYRDSRFTYIRAKPQEAPAVYEEKDGKASLINFKLRDGLYVLDKVVSRGYLAIGNRRLYFAEE